MKKIDILQQVIGELLQDKVFSNDVVHGELTIIVDADDIYTVMSLLKDNADTKFEQCIDLCGVDYLNYHDDYTGLRFAVVYHLLSVTKNWRVRVKAFLKDDSLPLIKSVVDIWSATNWYEREAFDLYGIIFDGHPDLRRILTDYGFIGYPFRKDFPLSGHMEMIYDEEQKRVIYQPVTIEPREITPRIIREDSYCGGN